LKPSTCKFDKILDLRLLNSVTCWAQILVDLARCETQFPCALCISHIYPPSNLDKHYSAETSNTHSFSLRGPSAQMIVKIANLVLVLERQTTLNYKMQNDISRVEKQSQKNGIASSFLQYSQYECYSFSSNSGRHAWWGVDIDFVITT
jgi:hypothetical protein